MEKQEILKTIVGSQAHGLAEENSDTDYRGVYVCSTKEFFKLGAKIKGSHWMEGETEDNTAYEIGHFLQLAIHCNPSIMEVFKAPIAQFPLVTNEDYIKYAVQSNWGVRLRGLFPYVWEPQQAFDAFTGYGKSQRTKMLDNHLNRWQKFGVAYLRTLSNLLELLRTGNFSLEVKAPVFKALLRDVRDGGKTVGWIIDYGMTLTDIARKELDLHLKGQAAFKQEKNIDKINEFLFDIRKNF